MEITIKLTADQVSAMRDFLSTQTKQVPNPITGNVSIQPAYATVEACILEHVELLLNNALKMFPPAAVQAQIEKIRAAEEQIRAASRVDQVMPTIERIP